MSEGAHFGRIECLSGLCFVGNHEGHDETPVVRTIFPRMTGVDGGETTFIDADKSVRNCAATTMLA